jgi:hypothetical protein
MRIVKAHAAMLACAAALASTSVAGQSLTSRVSALVTDEPRIATYTPDPVASAATRDTVTQLFGIELATQPAPSSAVGIVYRLDPVLGVVARSSENFGPFFTERVLRSGRGNVSAGIVFQAAQFSSIQGVDLTNGAFPATAQKSTGSAQPSSVDYLTLDLESQTATALVNLGVSDRVSVGAMVPFVRVRLSGTRQRWQQSRFTTVAAAAGWATGLGDLGLNARVQVAGSGGRGVALGGDVRLPTGREEDFLGAGAIGARALVIGSWEVGPIGLSGNAAVGVGGVSRSLEWNGAATYAATPRVTLVGELLVRRLSDLHELEAVYRPHAQRPGIETLRWVPTDSVLNTALVAAGGRWNLAGGWLLNTNVLIRVTEGGLRSRVTPAVSLDYDFGS